MADREVNIQITADDKASPVIQSVTKKIEDATKGVADIGTKLDEVGRTFQRTGRVLMVELTAPIILFGKSAVDAAVAADTATRQLQKVFNGTGDQLKADLLPAAQELAITWGKNKVEVLGLMQELAAMGFATEDIISGTTEAINVSQLGNLDLAKSMELVVSVMQNYGVRGKDLTQVVANLNAVEDSGAATLGDMADGIARAASLSKEFHLDIRELGAVMSVLVGRGVEAATAGNSLKTLFSRLLSPTADVKDALETMGVSIEETTKKTGNLTRTVGANEDEYKRLEKRLQSTQASLRDYEAKSSGANLTDEARKKKIGELNSTIGTLNSQMIAAKGVTESYYGTTEVGTGKLKNGMVVLQEMALAWGKLDEVQRANLDTVFAGRFQVDKFAKIMDDLSQGEMAEYNRIIKETSDEQANLERMAKALGISLESMQTKLGRLNTQWIEFKQFVGNDIVPILAKLIDERIIPLINKFKELDETQRNNIVKWGMFLAALGPVLVYVGVFIQAIGFLINAFKTAWTIVTVLATAFSGLATALGVSAFALAGIATAGIILGAVLVALMTQCDLFKTKAELIAQAQDKQRIAQDNLNNAMKESVTANQNLEQANINLETANMRVTTTQNNLNTAIEKYGTGSPQVKEAVLQYRQAQLDAGKAIDGVTKATEEQRKKDEELMKQQDSYREARQKTIDSINDERTAWEKLKDSIKGVIEKMNEKAKAGNPFAGSKIGGSQQHGGVVPGDVGQPVPIIAHGGERVIPRGSNSSAPFANGGGGGGGVTINMNGPITMDSEERTRQLADKIMKMMGRQSELSQYGVGF